MSLGKRTVTQSLSTEVIQMALDGSLLNKTVSESAEQSNELMASQCNVIVSTDNLFKSIVLGVSFLRYWIFVYRVFSIWHWKLSPLLFTECRLYCRALVEPLPSLQMHCIVLDLTHSLMRFVHLVLFTEHNPRFAFTKCEGQWYLKLVKILC